MVAETEMVAAVHIKKLVVAVVVPVLQVQIQVVTQQVVMEVQV
jgi:hypothetical protein